MANNKITDLPILSTYTATNLVEVVDVTDTTDSPEGTSKQMEIGLMAGDITQVLDNGNEYVGLQSQIFTDTDNTQTILDANGVQHKDLAEEKAIVINGNTITRTTDNGVNSVSLEFQEPTGTTGGGKIIFPDVGDEIKTVMLKENNLSDLTNAGTARTNLSIYSKTEVDAKFTIKTLYLNTVDSTPSTGTTAEVIHYTILIPANTIPANCAITITSRSEKNNDTGTFTIKLQKNTSASLSGATQLGVFTTSAAANRIAPMLRTFGLNAGNLNCYPTTSSATNDLGAVSVNPTLVAFDNTVDNYIMVTLTGSAGATLKGNIVEAILKY